MCSNGSVSLADNSDYVPLPVMHPVEADRHYGTIFTYLPLPIHSGLPVHINGAFAVTSNRRHMCERNEDGNALMHNFLSIIMDSRKLTATVFICPHLFGHKIWLKII